MATLEKGKGKRKQVIEIARHGALLCLRETEAGHARLPGYRRFASEAAAAAALAAEVRTRAAGGMLPADAEARTLVESQPPKTAGPPALPIRVDLGIYNEATGFVVTSRKMAGKALEEGSSEWKKAVTRGDMLPLTLVQDDPFIIRIVAGDALTPQEQEEWVARVDWHLNIPDGKLCVTGGSVFTNEDYDADDPQTEEYVGQVLVPKGRYRAALYTQVHGVNGGSVMDFMAGGHDRGEPLEAWFDRTRAGGARPGWDDMETVDFLLHLEPIDTVPKSGLSELPDDGWFGGHENARKPDRCPLGLEAADVVRTAREESPGTWTYVRHVFEEMPMRDRRAVRGGAVDLPLDSLARAVRLAWFASRFTTTELRLTPPSGGALDLTGDWPDGVVAVVSDGAGRVLFDADLDISGIMALLPSLQGRFASLPAGTVLDVCCVRLDTLPGTPEEAGLLSLRGVIRGGTWRIAQAYPEVDGDTLRAALTLAGEVGGTAIAVRSEDEGAAILAWARRSFGHHLKDNPPRLEGGAIRFRQAGHEVAQLGIATFAVRHSGTWPVTTIPPAEEDEADDGDGMFPATPIKGAEVWVAPSGRAYHQTMATLVSEDAADEVGRRERPLMGAGFKHVGDVLCSDNEFVGIRGYARKGGSAWACCRVSLPADVEFAIISTFPGAGAVLVTTADPDLRDDAGAKVFRQGFAGAELRVLIEQHERRAAELTATLGPPRPVEPRLKDLAETLEAVRAKT